jgi:hypothetical protein
MGLNAPDRFIEVETGVVYEAWVVRKNHQSVSLTRFRGPVEQQPVHVAAMPTLKDVRVGTELTLIGGDQLGAVNGPRRGFEVEQL